MEIESIIVEDLVKKYKRFTLRVERLVFTRGINLILGPNGSGKSTLLKTIAGLAWPTRGRVVAVTRAGEKLPAHMITRHIGYVGEDIAFPNIRVRRLLEAFSTGSQSLDTVIGLLGLEQHLDKKYNELSTGYKRRVQIAIALLKNPPILVLDEAFANIDILMVKPLEKLLEKQRRDKIILVSSHIPLNTPTDTITVIDQGRIVYHGRHTTTLKLRLRIGEETITVGKELVNELIKPLRIEGTLNPIDEIIEKHLNKTS